MKQFFGIYSKEERCRFFKCDEGTITSENVETNCVFQGSFPWEPLQTLIATGKKHIMKACTTSSPQEIKTTCKKPNFFSEDEVKKLLII